MRGVFDVTVPHKTIGKKMENFFVDTAFKSFFSPPKASVDPPNGSELGVSSFSPKGSFEDDPNGSADSTGSTGFSGSSGGSAGMSSVILTEPAKPVRFVMAVVSGLCMVVEAGDVMSSSRMLVSDEIIPLFEIPNLNGTGDNTRLYGRDCFFNVRLGFPLSSNIVRFPVQ